jgi:effector-binding domain-containing protein
MKAQKFGHGVFLSSMPDFKSTQKVRCFYGSPETFWGWALMTHLKQTVWVMIVAILGVGNVMATEEAEYTVVLKDQSFEVRDYEPHILAETIVDGKFSNAGNKAFGRLFKYISGDNTSQQTIEMTSPVAQEAESEKIDMTSPVGQKRENDSWVVSFMMPASYTMETLPQPKDPKITLRQVPRQRMAVVRYSGTWSEKGYQNHKNKLDAWINENGFRAIGEPVWARYNPPFMPWFLRRNEVLVPIVIPVDIE